jgi:hypothetical protein
MRQMTTQVAEIDNSPSRRQFTLAGLLSYMLAVSVYMSMMASAWASLVACGPLWPIFVTVPTAWCVLWWFYRRWRVPQALRALYMGPAIGGVILLFCLIDIIPVTMAMIRSSQESHLQILADTVLKLFFFMLGWFGVGAAFSLPVATAMLLYWMLWPTTDDVMEENRWRLRDP